MPQLNNKSIKWLSLFAEDNEPQQQQTAVVLPAEQPPPPVQQSAAPAPLQEQVKEVELIIKAGDIKNIPCESHYGEKFGNLVCALVRLKNGSAYDLLLDNENNAMLTRTSAVNRIEVTFYKNFFPALLAGNEVLISKV
jgi:hypothetical protein